MDSNQYNTIKPHKICRAQWHFGSSNYFILMLILSAVSKRGPRGTISQSPDLKGILQALLTTYAHALMPISLLLIFSEQGVESAQEFKMPKIAMFVHINRRF